MRRAISRPTRCIAAGDTRCRYQSAAALRGATITDRLRATSRRTVRRTSDLHRCEMEPGQELTTRQRAYRRGGQVAPAVAESRIGVSTGPGHRTLTLTPWRAASGRSVVLSPTTACLVVE